MSMQGEETLNKNLSDSAGAVLLVDWFCCGSWRYFKYDEPLMLLVFLKGDNNYCYRRSSTKYLLETMMTMSAIGLSAPTFSGPNENSEIISLEKNGNAKALLFLSSLVWITAKQKFHLYRNGLILLESQRV